MNELINKWQGQAEKLAPIYMDLAQVQIDLKKYTAAETQLTKVIAMAQDTKLISNETHAKALELKGEVQLAQNQRDSAIATFTELLDTFEPTLPIGSVRYKVGKLLFEQGKLSEAEKVWEPLSQKSENKLWSQMAREQLAHAKWKDDYKKYINRIPAMSKEKK